MRGLYIYRYDDIIIKLGIEADEILGAFQFELMCSSQCAGCGVI
jgi:hypothetical protein